MRRIAVTGALIALVAASSACSRGSDVARPPVGISGSINGLQRSQCDCGGLETKRRFEARKALEKAAAQSRRSNDGI